MSRQPINPRLAEPRSPAGHRAGNRVIGPLGSDESCHAHFVASFTHRSTDRLSTQLVGCGAGGIVALGATVRPSDALGCRPRTPAGDGVGGCSCLASRRDSHRSKWSGWPSSGQPSALPLVPPVLFRRCREDGSGDATVQAKRIVDIAIATVGALQQDAAMCVRAKSAARA